MGNVPFNPRIHRTALQIAAPSLRQVPANDFGDSGSNRHWFECDVKTSEAQALDEACADLGIYSGVDTAYPGRACRKLCRYVRDPLPASTFETALEVDSGE